MVNLSELFIQKGLSTSLFYASLYFKTPVRNSLESLSGIKWNRCPGSNGITVQIPVELVSRMLWNMHSPNIECFSTNI